MHLLSSFGRIFFIYKYTTNTISPSTNKSEQAYDSPDIEKKEFIGDVVLVVRASRPSGVHTTKQSGQQEAIACVAENEEVENNTRVEQWGKWRTNK